MTPQLQQAIRLLQLSNIELCTYVEAELERNPLLERDETRRSRRRQREDVRSDDAGDADGESDWSTRGCARARQRPRATKARDDGQRPARGERRRARSVGLGVAASRARTTASTARTSTSKTSWRPVARWRTT